MEKGVRSEYWSQDQNRKAVVFRCSDEWCVDLFENGKFLEQRPLYGKSEYYAEDLAENFVNYWGEFNK